MNMNLLYTITFLSAKEIEALEAERGLSSFASYTITQSLQLKNYAAGVAAGYNQPDYIHFANDTLTIKLPACPSYAKACTVELELLDYLTCGTDRAELHRLEVKAVAWA